MGNYEADVSVLTEQFLNYLNVCGQKLGYPFMLYSNGECGKKLVSSDGKHNAVAKVLKSSLRSKGAISSSASDVELKTDKVSVCEVFFEYINKYGRELGFPFVILKDGSVVKTPLSAQDKTTVIVKVLRAFDDDAKMLGVDEAILLKEKNEERENAYAREQLQMLKAIVQDDDVEGLEKLGTLNHQMTEYLLTNASKKMLMVFLRRCKRNSLNLKELDLLWLKKDMELLDTYYWWVRGPGK